MLIEKLVSLCLQQEEILASKVEELPLPYYKSAKNCTFIREVQKQQFALLPCKFTRKNHGGVLL